ncbi:PhzF family phenazine biosynthesis protein [Roseococcus sp. YIM B11640]|uniref:PhzF family phenazine biosynthesis protein n=1 Tax=Roseococcus sp. YIM B11640 TaxID=3133973 RepID=UPI003C7C500F
MELEFATADVFTTRRFAGNPLGLVFGAEEIAPEAMQDIAREMSLPETVFVLPAEAPGADIRLRIFTPARELPFAGHPSVGAAVMLARRFGHAGDTLVMQQEAGLVPAQLTRDAAGLPVAAEIEAPLPLGIGAELDRAAIAACAALPEDAIHVNGHPPLLAGCGVPFAIAEVEDAEALAAAMPDVAAMARYLPGLEVPPVGLLLHTPLGIGRRRARMFAPLGGILEDPATGAANVALAGLLLHLAGGTALTLDVEQGIEMGRPSELVLAARQTAGGIRVRVGGGVVAVSRGFMTL